MPMISSEIVSQDNKQALKQNTTNILYQYDIFLKTRKNIFFCFFPCMYAVYKHRELSSGANSCSQWKMETGVNRTMHMPSALFIPYIQIC